MRRPVALLLALVAVCILPLALGAERILLLELPGRLPLGTLMAALALVAAAAVPFAASRSNSALRRISAAAVIAALAWLPVGIYLSGSASLNFVEDAADAALYWRLTTGLVAVILMLLAWAAVTAAVRWRARGRAEAT